MWWQREPGQVRKLLGKLIERLEVVKAVHFDFPDGGLVDVLQAVQCLWASIGDVYALELAGAAFCAVIEAPEKIGCNADALKCGEDPRIELKSPVMDGHPVELFDRWVGRQELHAGFVDAGGAARLQEKLDAFQLREAAVGEPGVLHRNFQVL